GIAVARDMPAVDQPGAGNDGITDPAYAVCQTVITHSNVAGVEARMDVDERAGFVGRFPKRIEVGRIEHRPNPPRQRRDHDTAEPSGDRGLEHGSSAHAILRWNRCQRDKVRRSFGSRQMNIVEETAPGFAFGGWKIVAKPVDPPPDHLLVDSVL